MFAFGLFKIAETKIVNRMEYVIEFWNKFISLIAWHETWPNILFVRYGFLYCFQPKSSLIGQFYFSLATG